MRHAFYEDIQTIVTKDPAAHGPMEALSYPGLWAIWYHRISHFLWLQGYKTLSRYLSQFGRFWTGIEIHPGAKIGRRLFIDHGMGIVIGETAEIGDDVLLYQGVTLGGTGNAEDRNLPRRHPKLGNRVIVGTGTAVIGAIEIASDVTIGAGSLVRQSVLQEGATVVGNPGRVVKINGERVTHNSHISMEKIVDPRDETIARLVHDVNELKILQAQFANLQNPSVSATPPASENIPDYEI
jgi:serine O-acetyltransferase